MEFKKPFIALFNDDNWLKKSIIGIICSIFSILIIPVFILIGYGVEIIQSVSQNKEGLPEWNNIGNKIKKGFSLFIINIIYLLPVFIVFLLNIFAFSLLGFGGSTLTANNLLGPIASVGSIFSLFGFLAELIFFGLYVLFLAFLTPAIIVRYAKTESIKETIKVNQVLKIAKSHIGDLFVILGIVILLDIFSVMLSMPLALLLKDNWVVIYIINPLITGPFSFYVFVVQYNFFGQLGRTIKQGQNLTLQEKTS